MHRLLKTFGMALVALVWQASAAHAQHAGDVAFHYSGGSIEIIPGDEGLIFEGDFPTSGLFERFASDPGFISELDQGLGINAGDIMSYNVLDNLLFWSGGDFASPGAATITIDNAVGANTVVGGSTGVLVPGGVIGQADGSGNFHSHLDFELSAGAALGVYGMKWQLDTDELGVGNSDAFFLMFNYGLSPEDFETAVGDFASIPEPASLAQGAMGACALALVGWPKQRGRRGRLI